MTHNDDARLDDLLGEAVVARTEDIASPFVVLFEAHLAPDDWRENLDTERARHLAHTLAELQATAKQVLASALDASVAKLGRERLAELVQQIKTGQ